MDTILNVLYGAALIAVVVGLFNVIIFVHELGHFLAARWRGLQVDRFQIWFGKPIWKKERNGVQYGLGWIPAGGFVALPQMAPMESIEGSNRESEDGRPLPRVKPLDKIIVAFAGPLFSFLLALTAGVVVWNIGRPKDFVESQVIGYVAKDSPAEEAGLKVGDKILEVNGEAVHGFVGSPALDSIQESIMLSEGDSITFTIERPGVGIIQRTSEFKIPETSWFRRKGMRQVGIWTKNKTVIGKVSKGSPADQAGLKKGDLVVSVDGHTLNSNREFVELVEHSGGRPIELLVERDGKLLPPITVRPQIPRNENLPEELRRPMIGVGWGDTGEWIKAPYHPDPFTQVKDSLRMMWVTITSIASRESSIGIQHLSGPVGIGGAMFDLLRTPDGWKRLLWFMVLFNVNLAVLNMLPFPILDGGHIVLATGEMIAGRPVKARILEVVQTAFALALLTLFLFITSKDIGDRLGFGDPKEFEWSTSTDT